MNDLPASDCLFSRTALALNLCVNNVLEYLTPTFCTYDQINRELFYQIILLLLKLNIL